MGGRRAQVALFVLLGVIILVGVILALYLIHEKKISTTSTDLSQQLDEQNNPELAAEKARMQQRVDDCLARTAQDSLQAFVDSGTQVASIAEAEQLLSDDIAQRFPDCFFAFNTIHKLAIIGDTPKVIAILGPGTLRVSVTYAAKGTFEEQSYQLQDYSASAATRLRETLDSGFALQQALSGTLDNTGGPGSADYEALAAAKSFIDDDCYVDLHAYEDQGIYADMFVHDDDTMTALFYNYKDWKQGDPSPEPVVIDLPACVPASKG